MNAIGDVDEANCAIGLAIAALDHPDISASLSTIQNELFDLGADLATPGEDFTPTDMALRILPGQVERLEAEIDDANASLEPLRSFILPSGGPGVAQLHLARAIVRRAERSAVAAAEAETVNPAALIYLNRLSDLLFVLSRRAAAMAGGEVLWKPGATR